MGSPPPKNLQIPRAGGPQGIVGSVAVIVLPPTDPCVRRFAELLRRRILSRELQHQCLRFTELAD